MGIPVLIMGESGSGKSFSFKNFNSNEVGIFNIASKPFPFKEKFPKANGANYATIINSLSVPKKKNYIIDDSQYLMAFEAFDRVRETGYGKFTDIAVNFRNLIKHVVENTPDDVIVYFLHHTETSESGKIKAKTIGRMLDSQLTLEGLFSIVLLAKAEGGEYFFETQSDGYTTAKSPFEMFKEKIPNDLAAVDARIREYYFEDEKKDKKESKK